MSSVHSPKTADIFLLDWLNVFLSFRWAYALRLQTWNTCREFLISLLFSPGACSTKAECTMSQRFQKQPCSLLPAPRVIQCRRAQRECVLWIQSICSAFRRSPQAPWHLSCVYGGPWAASAVQSFIAHFSHSMTSPTKCHNWNWRWYSVWKCIEHDDCVNELVPLKQWNVWVCFQVSLIEIGR